MAFPVQGTHSSGTQTSDATTWTISYPATVNAGDLLVAVIVTDLVPTITFPSGWEIIFAAASSGSSAKLHIAVMEAAGTEGGGTFDISVDSSERGPWSVTPVSGWFGDSSTWANSVAAATGVTATTATPDPPSLNPAGWGTEDTLWIAAVGYNSGNVSVSSYPTDYTGGINIREATTAGGGLGYAFRGLNAGSEDPGTFTLSGGQNSVATTVAIRPAAGGADFPVDSQPAAFVLVGSAAGVLVARLVSAVAGSFAVAGSDTGLAAGRLVSVDPGGFAVTGSDGTLAVGRAVAADPAICTVTGSDADLVYTTAGAYTLEASPGVYAATGADSATTAGRALDAQPGTYTTAGAEAGLVVAVPGAYVLDAQTGAYLVTGSAASNAATRLLSVDAAAYAVTGTPASLFGEHSIAATAASYTVTGDTASAIADRLLAADPGTVVFTGVNASIGTVFDLEIDAAAGNVAVAGIAADLDFAPGLARMTTRGGRIRWNTTGRITQNKEGAVA